MSQARQLTPNQANDLIQVLFKRKAVVDCLHEGITAKRDMVNTLDISRPTVDRSIRDLEDQGVIERGDGDYKFTLYGLFVVNKFRNILSTYETFIRVRPLLLSLPSETDLTMNVLEQAEVTVPKEYAPLEPLRYCEGQIQDASEIKVILPTLLPRQLEFFADQVANGTLECDLIVREEAVDVLLTSYAEYLEALLNADDRCRVWSTTDPTEYGVLLIDSDEVHIIGYSKDGGITAVITNDSNTAVEWAENVFVQCRQGSHEVSFRGNPDEVSLNDHLTSFVLDG
jgi:predicted transcriptional regulator